MCRSAGASPSRALCRAPSANSGTRTADDGDPQHDRGCHGMSENPVRLEPNNRRVRVLVDGVVIADTIRSIYLFELGHLPVYYFPKDDVRFDLLEHTDHSSHCPRKGDAEYWSIVVGDRHIDNAVWSYPVPLAGTDDL